jgi:hypothetical protein
MSDHLLRVGLSAPRSSDKSGGARGAGASDLLSAGPATQRITPLRPAIPSMTQPNTDTKPPPMSHLQRQRRRKAIQAALLAGGDIQQVADAHGVNLDYAKRAGHEVGLRFYSKEANRGERFFYGPKAWARVLYIIENWDMPQRRLARDLGVSPQAVNQHIQKISKNLYAKKNKRGTRD